MVRPPPAAVLRQLLDAARLSEADVRTCLDRAVDQQYWRGIAPALHVAGRGVVLEPAPITGVDGGFSGRSRRALRDDGICELRQAIAADTVGRLNAAIDAVVEAGWPPVFAFVYDECWLCARAPAILQVVADHLGPDCLQIPHVWAHVVRPVSGAAGWGPHTDGGGRARLSAWVALTLATVQNGCMHAVPLSAAPETFTERFNAGEPLPRADLLTLLGGVRAMPAEPGDVLAWTFDVVHWGGRARTTGVERRSLSFEYIAAAETPAADEQPLVPLSALPSMDLRLRAIAAGILEYRKFEPSLIRYEELARRVLARLASAAGGVSA